MNLVNFTFFQNFYLKCFVNEKKILKANTSNSKILLVFFCIFTNFIVLDHFLHIYFYEALFLLFKGHFSFLDHYFPIVKYPDLVFTHVEYSKFFFLKHICIFIILFKKKYF